MLPALATALALAATGSGLYGTVTRGPITPVCRIGSPCSEPAARTVLVFRRSGRETRTTTDARGRYRVALVPGTWSVALTRTGLGSLVQPRLVRVRAGAFRHVDLSIDTGIR